MKAKELRAMPEEKLVEELKNSRIEVMKLKSKRALGTIEKPTLVKNAKRRVARILTALKVGR